MFGYVTANWKELSKEQQDRYGAVYCGICREIHLQSSGLARLALSYDMAFLAMLLMSLYEPQETTGRNHCMLHPVKRRPWVDNDIIRYTADMNVALAYYNAVDDWRDDRRFSALLFSDALLEHRERITKQYPRQCAAIAKCMERLTLLEQQNCPNPDALAGAFGELMAELLVYREDLWAPTLRQLGFSLGRFIYLVDAAVDYRKDRRNGSYNPFLAMGGEEDPARWEAWLVLAMARATDYYEKLPLVQDKALLDNILYSGVWVKYRGNHREEANHD